MPEIFLHEIISFVHQFNYDILILQIVRFDIMYAFISPNVWT